MRLLASTPGCRRCPRCCTLSTGTAPLHRCRFKAFQSDHPFDASGNCEWSAGLPRRCMPCFTRQPPTKLTAAWPAPEHPACSPFTAHLSLRARRPPRQRSASTPGWRAVWAGRSGRSRVPAPQAPPACFRHSRGTARPLRWHSQAVAELAAQPQLGPWSSSCCSHKQCSEVMPLNLQHACS